MKPSIPLILAVAGCLAASSNLNPLFAQPVDTAQELQSAIDAGSGTITLGASFSVATPVYIGTTSSPAIVINGGGNTISGSSEIFFVQSGNLTISNATLSGNAVGGNGGAGQATGGGALGAGGAIFVGSTATVTASNVQFSSNSATGGSAGPVVFIGGFSGGGGMNGGSGGDGSGGGGGGGGGNGGAGALGISRSGGGGGGLTTVESSGDANGQNGGGANGGAGGSGGAGGPNSGGGGSSSFGSTGGNGGVNGGGGGGAPAGAGGNGGDYAGGGGATGNGGNGGFGGGGGGGVSRGGPAGFGGGGGGTSVINNPGGHGGTGGGNGANDLGPGGGGAGLGGAVFEQAGGEFIITGNQTFSGNSVAGGNGANSGAAAGSDIFVMTGAGIIIAPGTGNTITVNGTIADDSASSLPAGGSYVPGTATGVGIQFGSSTSTSGTVVLSGANTFSGGGTITNATVVEAETATALGTGPITNTTGVLTVGNGNHTIQLNGYTQQTLGALGLYVNGSGSSATADLLHVTNTLSSQASLGGSLVINFSGFTASASGAAQTLDFTVVQTNAGYTGTFSALDSLGLNGATASLDYVGDDVNLLIAIPASTISALDLTSNERGIVSPINSAILTGHTTQALTVVQTALLSLPVTEVGGALDQLAPTKFSQFASSTAFNEASFYAQDMDDYLTGQRGTNGTFAGSNGQLDTRNFVVNDPNVDPGLQMIHSRMLAWDNLPQTISDVPGAVLGGVDMKQMKTPSCCSAADQNPWNVFVRGNVILAQGFSQDDVPHYDDNTESVVAGADYRFTPNLLAGVTMSYAHTDVTLDDFGSSATVDSYSPGVYASYADSGWYANFIGRYSYNSYTEQRDIAFLNQTANGGTTGNEGVVDLDGGYDFHSGAWTYGPVAGLQYTHLTVNSFAERNSDAALTVAEDQSDSLRSRLGGEVRFDGHWCGVTLSPHLEATWQHEFMDQSRGITSQFTQFSGGSFTVRTDSPSQDSALVDVGLDAQVDKTITVFGDYLVQAGQSNYFGQSVQAGVKVSF